jgi:outer membrane protein
LHGAEIERELMNRYTAKVLATVAVVVLAASGAVAQTAKIGVFDPQRVSEETGLGRQVQEQLSAFRDRKQAEIGDKQRAIEDQRKQLSQQALSLSSERRADMEKDIQRQLLEFESAKERAGREMQLEIAAAQSSFQEKLLDVIEAMGRDDGFSLILDANVIAWAAKEIDVTTAIVDRFDRTFPVSKPKE